MPMMLQDLVDMVQNPPSMQPPGQLPPGTPPNGLLANLMPLMQLGSVDQRHKLLQQQYDQAGQTAAGAPIDYSKGKGAPLALAGLVNLVSAGLGGYQQGKATGGLRDLVTQQDAGRTAAAQAVQAAPMSDLQSALMASPTDAPAKLQAAQDATGQRSKLGMLLGMTGDPQLAGMGKQLASEAGQDHETMLGIPQQRQQLAGGDIKNQEAQADLAAKLRGENASKSPAVAGVRKQFLKAMGYAVADDASPEDVAAILPDAQKQYGEDIKAKEIGKFAVNPVTGRLYNTRTGEDVPNSGGPGDPTTDKRFPKMQSDFQKDLDPNINRAGEVGKNQARVNAANRVLALAVGPDGNAANLSSNQMPELAQSVASLISNAGSGAQAQIEHLLPHSIVGDVNKMAQWLTNEPRGAGQQAFVQQMIDTAKREQGTAAQAVRQAQGQRLSGHLQYLQMFPDAAKAQLQSYGFDPAEVDFKTGAYTPKATAPQGSSPQTFAPKAPAKIKGDDEFNALPSGAEFIGPDGVHRRKP